MDRIKVRSCIVLLIAILLSSCVVMRRHPAPKVFVINPEPRAEQLKHDQAETIINQLYLDPTVRVVQTAYMTRIKICSDALFGPSSPILNAPSPSLDSIVELTRALEPSSVEISAYTNWRCSIKWNKALARRQAQSVEKYMWSRGIDTRLMYTRAYGATCASPVPFDCGNRRIEIQFPS